MVTLDEKTLERFMGKVEFDWNTPSLNGSPCMVWTANKHVKGYGHFKLNNKTRKAHRIAYQHFVGEIPSGIQIDHICKIRACVNTQHLRLATQSQNAKYTSSRKGSSSKYLGVSWFTAGEKWKAQIQDNKKKIHIGYFDSEDDAANAYDAFALIYYGDRASLNFPLASMVPA